MNKLFKIDKDYSHSKLSQDLMAEFPDMKRFSERNIKYINDFYFIDLKRQLGNNLLPKWKG